MGQMTAEERDAFLRGTFNGICDICEEMKKLRTLEAAKELHRLHAIKDKDYEFYLFGLLDSEESKKLERQY